MFQKGVTDWPLTAPNSNFLSFFDLFELVKHSVQLMGNLKQQMQLQRPQNQPQHSGLETGADQ